MRTTDSGLINSGETSKWLLYTSIIFTVKCRGNSLPCYLFFPVPLYAFDFKFYIQGYILIKSILALSQLKLFHECKMLVVVVEFVLLLSQSPYKSEIVLE